MVKVGRFTKDGIIKASICLVELPTLCMRIITVKEGPSIIMIDSDAHCVILVTDLGGEVTSSIVVEPAIVTVQSTTWSLWSNRGCMFIRFIAEPHVITYGYGSIVTFIVPTMLSLVKSACVVVLPIIVSSFVIVLLLMMEISCRYL